MPGHLPDAAAAVVIAVQRVGVAAVLQGPDAREERLEVIPRRVDLRAGQHVERTHEAALVEVVDVRTGERLRPFRRRRVEGDRFVHA